MLSVDELYDAVIIRTAEEWDAVEEHICSIVNSSNLCTILNTVGEVALKLPYGTYAYTRAMYLYNKIDSVAKNKAALGLF